MRIHLKARSAAMTADRPVFTLAEIAGAWRVRITWSDGAEGPVIAFATKRDAEIWIIRDASAWLDRLALLASS